MAQKGLKRGVFISFEGPEGSGKSTHVRMLCIHLRKMGFQVVHLREPGSTLIGEKIRRILLDAKSKNMDIVCEMLLYQAARAQLVKEKIISALKARRIVIVDRFLDATVCYQGFGSGLDVNFIERIGRLATYGIEPHLTILLDLGVEEGLRRSRRKDRIEKRSLQFHRRVRKGYLKLARENPGRIKVVPVTSAIEKTQQIIRKIAEDRLRWLLSR